MIVDLVLRPIACSSQTDTQTTTSERLFPS
jgi:hypothetical protein